VGPQGPAGPQGTPGIDGVFRPEDYWDGPTWRYVGASGIPEYGAWDCRFRKAKNGLVYYSIRTYKNGQGNQTWKEVILPEQFRPISDWEAATSFDRIALLPGWNQKDGGLEHSVPAQIMTNDTNTSMTLYVPIRDDWQFLSSGSYPSVTALPKP
jgi:hypothetical protein